MVVHGGSIIKLEGRGDGEGDGERNVIKEPVEGVEGAFLLRNVLSETECEALIKATEDLGYTEAPISTGLNSAVMALDVRNNKRVMWAADDETLEEIWRRVQEHLPQSIITRLGGEWRLVQGARGLNERLRFYRYEEGERFEPHYDGCFPRSSSCQSHLTFIVYLNGGLDGGETTFFPNSWKPSKKNCVRVNPTTGTALLFFHQGQLSPLHEGSEHRSKGKFKYAMRSDVMYELVR